MIKGSTMFVAGITFSVGLLMGLLLHLPGAYSPSTSMRHRRSPRDFDALPIGQRSLLTADDTRGGDTEQFATHKNTSSSKSDKVLNTFSPISKVGLLRTIPNVKQPEARPSSSKILENRAEKSGGNELWQEADTIVVNIEGANVDQRDSTKDKYEAARKGTVHDNDVNSLTNIENEIEIDLNNAENEADAEHTKSREHVNSRETTLQDLGVLTVVEDGIYWSSEVEDKVAARGFTDSDVTRWRETVNENKVVRIKEGCGRMQNRQVTFADGTLACARYRLNTDQMQGEVYSYYLSKLLNIPNVPPTLLELADTRSDKWSGVDEDVIAAQWHPGKVIALTPWIDTLESAYIPQSLRPKEGKRLDPNEDMSRLTREQVSELVQWSDLIVFDYLTANLDRVVNNMFNLQWNAAMMDSPTHNLEKDTKNGNLVFLDNESGLFHSYRLLGRYSSYHDELLKSLCVFRRQTADTISGLYKSRDIGASLQSMFEAREPLSRYLPRIPSSNIKTLQGRIDSVYQQIQVCQAKFSGNQR